MPARSVCLVTLSLSEVGPGPGIRDHKTRHVFCVLCSGTHKHGNTTEHDRT